MLREAMSNRKAKALSSVDVYDLATAVRDEFERVIESVGNEPVLLLVAKVVEVLEHLDRLSRIVQNDRIELEDVRLTVEKLQAEEALWTAEKAQSLKEKEMLENSWKTEVKEMTAYAAKLAEENLVLRLNVEELTTCNQDTVQSELTDRNELNQLKEEIQSLREKVTCQKDELQSLKRNMVHREADIEALQSQLDRFTKLNTDYRSRNSFSNRQIEQLLEEKAELEVQLREKAPPGMVQMRQHKTRSNARDSEEKAVNRESCNLEEWQKLLENDGKVIIDLTNPDRPRYSLKDMRKVVQERNDLKTQLYDAKEELLLYRPPQSDDSDGAVQGPINREPDEKLHPEKFNRPSGIQRLFQSFLKVSTK